MIKLEIVADSYWTTRLTTFTLTYPRFIHSQFMTHRVFSRNASSSRAIPTTKLVEQVRQRPCKPLYWLKNKKGMQGGPALEVGVQDELEALWLKAARFAADTAQEMADLGLHKQSVNRILEPFLPITVLVTATEWENFLRLRLADDSQPEIQMVAHLVNEYLTKNEPSKSKEHFPYLAEGDESLTLEERGMVSAARCARVSYLNHDGKVDIKKDLELARKLLSSGHMSPFEHQAEGLSDGKLFCANLVGWKSFRAILEDTEVFKSKRLPVEEDGWSE